MRQLNLHGRMPKKKQQQGFDLLKVENGWHSGLPVSLCTEKHRPTTTERNFGDSTSINRRGQNPILVVLSCHKGCHRTFASHRCSSFFRLSFLHFFKHYPNLISSVAYKYYLLSPLCMEEISDLRFQYREWTNIDNRKPWPQGRRSLLCDAMEKFASRKR